MTSVSAKVQTEDYNI